jgi:hypothetical protein
VEVLKLTNFDQPKLFKRLFRGVGQPLALAKERKKERKFWVSALGRVMKFVFFVLLQSFFLSSVQEHHPQQTKTIKFLTREARSSIKSRT